MFKWFKRAERVHPVVERCYHIVDQSKDIRRAIALIEAESVVYNSTAVDVLKEADRKLDEEWKVLYPYFAASELKQEDETPP